MAPALSSSPLGAPSCVQPDRPDVSLPTYCGRVSARSLRRTDQTGDGGFLGIATMRHGCCVSIAEVAGPMIADAAAYADRVR